MRTFVVSSVISSVLVMLASLAQAADEPKVEITSFIAAGQRTRAAELCGKVTGFSGNWLAVRVTVDPKSDRPGVYHVLAGKDGAFCTTVVSYQGLAEASIAWTSDKNITSDPAVMKPASSGDNNL
ncbi:hypothetical protein K2X30_13070 [bacterium]|nr:hypothetical protein [bacterium]